LPEESSKQLLAYLACFTNPGNQLQHKQYEIYLPTLNRNYIKNKNVGPVMVTLKSDCGLQEFCVVAFDLYFTPTVSGEN
jgi:hypothetical protein